ncbi:hypothetical protein B0H65DRAFT_423492 [Neurospora tetraspora]|uniref:Uncharacterized protein n=1 Tax=Neurospora tetraspora TaxID=94610 RepID=A0AAE0JGN6_9PEZI|nr:hypothetical protein B0H65DRAFT_423492 [Neurospora tetraspora]
MDPAHDITQKMEGLTIKPKVRAITPYTTNTTMESTHRITQEMEDMILNPKARVVTPFTATTSSHTQSVASQQQPQSSPPAPFIFAAGNPTGGYAYATSPTGLTFSNPNAGSSSVAAPSNHQSQSQDFDINHLLNCDDPIGFYKFSLYHSSQHHSPSHSHSHSHAVSHSASNRITKSRSAPSLRKRFHQARQPAGIMTPTMGTTVHKTMIEKVPGTTKVIYTTTAEKEAKEEETDRMTMAFFGHCLRRTKERVAAGKAAEAARQAQKQSESGMGACGEAWMPRAKISRTYVNGEGDVVEESWEKTTFPKWSWEEASDDGVDAVEEEVWEKDEMME